MRKLVLVPECGFVSHFPVKVHAVYVKADLSHDSYIRLLLDKGGVEVITLETPMSSSEVHPLNGTPFDKLYIDLGTSGTANLQIDIETI